MSDKYFRENEWWVSPYNFVPEVRNTFQLPKSVSIHDATLRDGEQTPGVVLSITDKIAIAEKLDEIGVDRIEAGMPAVSEQDFEAIKQISKLGLKSKIYTFARAMNADIDKALECGCHGVIIEVPIGYPKLKYQFKWTWEDVLRKSVDVINYAKSRGLHVVYFPYDTTRAREEDLTQRADAHHAGSAAGFGRRGRHHGLHSARGDEVHGAPGEDADQQSARRGAHAQRFRHGGGHRTGRRRGRRRLRPQLRQRTGRAHRQRGARGADRRAARALRLRHASTTWPSCPSWASWSAASARFPIAANKPILGDRNFTRESGIGVDLVVKEPLAMFGTHPALTGRKGEVVLGKKSGKMSITYNLEKMGITDADDEAIGEMLKRVKDKGIEKRGLLTDEEFRDIVDSVLVAKR